MMTKWLRLGWNWRRGMGSVCRSVSIPNFWCAIQTTSIKDFADCPYLTQQIFLFFWYLSFWACLFNYDGTRFWDWSLLSGHMGRPGQSCIETTQENGPMQCICMYWVLDQICFYIILCTRLCAFLCTICCFIFCSLQCFVARPNWSLLLPCKRFGQRFQQQKKVSRSIWSRGRLLQIEQCPKERVFFLGFLPSQYAL